uniref:WD repeat-containing protein 26-like isoform X2 n=1 Tax=Hirondellea gigas TaxID=1518452 RepID=A0A6A7G1M6_9CRUS
MQHQQEMVSNGAAPQTNGKTEVAPAINGVSEDIKKPSVKLDPINTEMVRLIGQHLTNLGFKSTVQQLMSESGCRLDHPEAGRVRKCVLMGDWKGATEALQHLEPLLDCPSHLTEMRFLILEQKYMELIECGDDIGALSCLRGEISPLEHNISKVHRLSSLIFYNNSTDLRKATNWAGSGLESRCALMDKISKYFPSTVMLPPRRLEKLVIQALQQQIVHCNFHNTTSVLKLNPGDNYDKVSMLDAIGSSGTLLTDHVCSKDNFPSNCVHTLTDHTDEVLTAAFSPNGLLLATAGKDSAIIIWEIDQPNFGVSRRHYLDVGNSCVVCLSWSHDSTKLISCMAEEATELIVWDIEEGKEICKVTESNNDSLTSACWYKDDERFVCGGLRGQFFLCNLEGTIIERWEGVRVQSMNIHSDGKTVLASDTHRRIRAYQLEDKQDYSILQEDHGIMSFTLDESGRFGLLNVTTQGVHLWDLKDRQLVRKFRGTTQGHCTIHSCFGGLNQDFVASGSEDSKVYVWHRGREQPVAVLNGHQRTVNCVAWNPTLPTMLVSVSDDRTVRIWGPIDAVRKHQGEPQATSETSEGEDDAYDIPLHSALASNGQLPHNLMSSLDISEH